MTREEVLAVLADKAGAELALDAPYPGDSLALVELVMDLEDALGVDLPEDEVTRTRTVGELVDLCVAKTAG